MYTPKKGGRLKTQAKKIKTSIAGKQKKIKDNERQQSGAQKL
jgi:hypothetical protein